VPATFSMCPPPFPEATRTPISLSKRANKHSYDKAKHQPKWIARTKHCLRMFSDDVGFHDGRSRLTPQSRIAENKSTCRRHWESFPKGTSHPELAYEGAG
jgi:hypothetical protein